MTCDPRPSPLCAYAELHCVTNFTFLRGASHPQELVARALALGYTALAITDECSVGGVVRAHMAAKSRPLQLLIGSEFRLQCGLHFVAIAIDRRGYGRLCRLITRGRRAAVKGSYALTRGDVEELGLEQCFILWLPPQDRCARSTAIPRPERVQASAPAQSRPLEGPQFHQVPGPWREELRWLAARSPGRTRIAVELLRDGADQARLGLLEILGRQLNLPLVASGDVHMHIRQRRGLQDVLTAIRLGLPVAKAGWSLNPNGERYLRERERLARLFPRPLLEETLAVAAQCSFSLDELRYEYPHELVPPGATPASHLRRLTQAGARLRWPEGVPPQILASIENELQLITELRYEPYFLTVHDIVAYARSRGILCQGRGSAANSVVCFCLHVTAVDPTRATLLFERFISRERHEPPDIDIDFEHERREEVIQYVYEKYGRDRAALAATVIMYRPRSALRDLGKVFGLDPQQCGRLARGMQWWDGSDVMPERVAEAGFDPRDPTLARLLCAARELLTHPGFPRHLSQHVGGFVICAGPLEELVPIENASMPDRTVVQWDKDDLNDLGLLKVDLLALGMLTALQRTFALLRSFRHHTYTLGSLPAEDQVVYDMICRADTVGVFQIESRAQMAMLPRLKPRTYYDLVIEVAIVRPGPIQGDMVHPYLQRRKQHTAIRYEKPEVEAVLNRTLGIPIFQEQVMQLAIVAAGFTPGEADALRRAMGAWKRTGGLEHLRARLLQGMRLRGYSEQFAQSLYKQMMGFGEYGFPECVVGSTRVVDADTGRWVSIDDIVSGAAHITSTLACDTDRRLRRRRVIAVKASGIKPVWRVHTALGHSVAASAEHPFLTRSGWRPLRELQAGEQVAAARVVTICGRRRWPQHEILVLADLIGAGSLCRPDTVCFHTTQKWRCDEFVKAVECFANTRAVVARHGNCFWVRVRGIDRSLPVGAVTWVRALGIPGHGARQWRLPPEVFDLDNEDIGLLLARLWEGDGGFAKGGHACYATAAPCLAQEVQHLLLRFGIIARLYRRKRMDRGRLLEHGVVTIAAEALQAFCRQVGPRFAEASKRRPTAMCAAPGSHRMAGPMVPAMLRQSSPGEGARRGLTWTRVRRTGLYVRQMPERGRHGCTLRRAVSSALGTGLRSPQRAGPGNCDVYWDEIVRIESLEPQPTYDLEIDGDHNFLANNLLVHNSHSASFALLAYDSAWLKCHEPAAFTCALLNSQPMGFYAPAQLVRDAREHGVEVRAVDVQESDFECTLQRRDDGEPALRLGFCLVKSLSAAGAQRIVGARLEERFASVQDLCRRAALARGDLEALAAAGALAQLSGNRHLAFWEVAGTEKPLPLAPPPLRAASIEEGRPLLAAPTEGQCIVADYAAVGLTLGRHPMALLRQRWRKRLLSAAELACVANGKWVCVAGIVLMRQRPQSAAGVTFLTLEDETGQVNLIVWESVGREQRRALVDSRLLEVYGELQREEGITHLIARKLTDRTALLGDLLTRSRDFH